MSLPANGGRAAYIRLDLLADEIDLIATRDVREALADLRSTSWDSNRATMAFFDIDKLTSTSYEEMQVAGARYKEAFAAFKRAVRRELGLPPE
jgi:hypothetical protein